MQPTVRRPLCIAVCLGVCLGLSSECLHAGDATDSLAAAVPAANDDTAESLRAYQQSLRNAFGGDDGSIPLDVKAECFEWVIRRYHLTSYNHVHHYSDLLSKVGEPPVPQFGDDNATWHGAFLAAMCYKYAVTKDQQTLALIGRLIEGLHLFIEVTGQPGLAARCVLEIDAPAGKAKHRYDSPDGRTFYYRSEAAKGTYNQVAGGYAALMMHVYKDLPAEQKKMARDDLAAMVLHLIDHNYKLTEKDGKPTKYGKMTPIVGSVGVPFNAQVAYSIVATGHHQLPADASENKRIRRAFNYLRDKHHVYYQSPLRHLVRPQRVGNSVFVKGMNDRNHVLNAAFVGLALEVNDARRNNRALDEKFLFRLGRTMYWTMRKIERERNSLCNFMWAGILSDKQVFKHIAGRQRTEISRQLPAVVATGIEQLRRCPLDRFYRPGKKIETREMQWIDAQRPHEVYFWKAGPFYKFEATGPPTGLNAAAIDYLYAFWVMRHYRLYERYRAEAS